VVHRPDAVTPHPASLTCSHHSPQHEGKDWAFDDRWRTETVVALARGILAEQAFDRMPILADALEEAGCDDTVILDHCRICPEHVMGCWVIEAVLAFESRQLVPPSPPRKATRLGRILDGMRKEMRILPTAAEVRADGPDTPDRVIARMGCTILVLIACQGLVALVMLPMLWNRLMK
jgi:hypothetical protein